MALKLKGSTSGFTAIDAPAVAGDNTLVLPGGNGTSGQYLQTDGAGALSWQTVTDTTTNLTRGTEVATTSGTSFDFTNLPSGVRVITVLLDTVSTNGGSQLLIQIGDSGGIETTGYVSQSGQTYSTTGNNYNSTAGFASTWGSTEGIRKGAIRLYNMSGNKWICEGSHTGKDGVNHGNVLMGGVKTLSGELTQVRITTVNGTDTFDQGAINILYEV
jgi:hypothetical protein